MSTSLDDLLWERDRRRYRGGTGSWSEAPAEAQLEGFVAFCRDAIKIAHPLGKRPFELRDSQVETARAYIEQDQVLILKARQIGFTTLSMAFVLWRALFFDEFSAIIISRKESDSKANLAMAINAYNDLPDRFFERLPKRTDNGASRMSFDNGSWIESHPAGGGNPARGRTVALMMLDEWAFMPDPDDAWAAVSPVTDIGGRIIALSTANGYGNLFHRMWVQASSGDNNFHPVFFPWWAVPERDESWYEAQKRDMFPWQLAQEYPSEPEEAFIKSGNPVFETELLRSIECEDPLVGNLVGETLALPEFKPDLDGFVGVYEEPQDGVSYVLGVDVAQGLLHGDYSSAHVINTRSGAVAAVWHGHIDPDLLANQVAMLGWWFNTALVGIEANNHGLTTLKSIQRLGYPNLYYRKRLGTRREVISEHLGFLTTKATKPFIIDGLNAALREGSLALWDEPTRQELIQYVRKPDGSTEGSPHDDRVMSLAIANEMRRHAFELAARVEAPRVPPNSPAWYLERFMEEDYKTRRGSLVLGAFNVRGR